MYAFDYVQPKSIDEALRAAVDVDSYFIAGGTNLIDLMKGGVETPKRLIDINSLGLNDITQLPDGGIRLGASVRNSDAANHALVRERYPLLSRAFLAGASPQLRNMATIGGNLLQRTRCDYFVDTGFKNCNKREPGAGCGARDGYNRMHAIFGASAQCVAVNPSDMNVALLALDAVVNVRGPRGKRKISMADFHRLPGDHPERDTNLDRGELIVSVDLPKSEFAKHSYYLKVRDRASYAFALVSVAAALQMEGTLVKDARVALGSVAHKPLLVADASKMLSGKSWSSDAALAIAEAAVAGAQPLKYNAYKIQMTKNAIVRALNLAVEAA
jgi:xanthine dehydrogenase YagS FAD-binding subunit